MPGWWTAARQAEAYNYLVYNGGLSPHGAAGLVSRWANVESTAGGATAQGGYKGRAFGIAQWLGPRLPPINGNTNFQAQLAYVVQELNGTERAAANVLRAANSPAEGARGASMYERASGYNKTTGIDNYTARTAQGLPAVLAIVGGGGALPPTIAGPTPPGDADASGSPTEADDVSKAGGLNEAGVLSPTALLLLIGGMALWYVLSD